MKISIVMMSYLGHYPGARSNPVPKFNRAVQSVVDQTYKDWELIIVSDGCELTNNEYEKNWSGYSNIKLLKTTKSEKPWPGTKRQLGVDHATGDWICYLDADDMFLDYRLASFAEKVESGYEAFFDSYVINPSDPKKWRAHSFPNLTRCEWGTRDKTSIELERGGIVYFKKKIDINPQGTWCIFHKRDISVKWQDLNTIGEDTLFIKNLREEYNYKTLPVSGYVICHLSNRVDI